MNTLIFWVGGILLTAGAVALAAYGGYFFISELFADEEAPLAVKIAIPAVCAGVALLLVGVIIDRARARKDENLDGVKY